jgi:hypothetical protein
MKVKELKCKGILKIRGLEDEAVPKSNWAFWGCPPPIGSTHCIAKVIMNLNINSGSQGVGRGRFLCLLLKSV